MGTLVIKLAKRYVCASSRELRATTSADATPNRSAHADAILAHAHNFSSATTMADGDKFLAENKLKDGVITLPSGLQYKVLEEGAGLQPENSSSIIPGDQ